LTPTEYVKEKLPPYDCVGAFRRSVVEEWLLKRRDYFAFEFHLILTFQLRHAQLFLDEPWGRYHTNAGNRVTKTSDVREFRDPVVFVEEHRPLLGTAPCVPLDECLRNWWLTLWRAGRREEARVIRSWLKERDVDVRGVVARRTWQKLTSHLRHRRATKPQVV
jgi:hypothetical protein